MPVHDPSTARRVNALRPFGARVAKVCVFLLIAYPIVGYVLEREFASSVGPIWDRVVLAALALIALVRYMTGHRPRGFRWFRFAGGYIVYCLALLFVGLILNPSVAFDGFSMDVEYIIYGLLVPLVVDAEDVPLYLYGIVAVSILLGFDGVFQYITKVPIPAGWSDVGETVRTRVFSVLGSPGELAARMEVGIPLLVALFFTDKQRSRRWLYAFGAICCFATLLFTYNRGAWLGLAVGILFVAVVYDRRLLLVAVALAAVLFFLPPVHHRVVDLFSRVYLIKSAQGGRLLRWSQAFLHVIPNPLFGAGLGRYGGAIAAAKHFSLYSDSYYAKILGESGLVGLVLFFAIQLAIVRDVMQVTVRRVLGSERFIALAGVVGLIAIIVHSFVENLYEYASTASLYYVLVGLLLVWGRAASDSHTTLQADEPLDNSDILTEKIH